MEYHTVMDARTLNIEVNYALSKTAGNQAELGRVLGVSRASVNEWVRTGRKYLPELRAYKFVETFGSPKSRRAA